MGFPRESSNNLSIERLKIVSPGADIVSCINEKKFVNVNTGASREEAIQDSRQKSTRVCLSADTDIGSLRNSNTKVAKLDFDKMGHLPLKGRSQHFHFT